MTPSSTKGFLFIVVFIVMKISPIQKKALFKVWDNFGPNIDSTKWIGVNFPTMNNYYLALCEYYGIDGNVESLKQYIIGMVNEYLSEPDNHVCPGGTVRMYNIDLEKEMGSESHMRLKYHGIGNKPFAYFAYNEDPDFECDEVTYNDIAQYESYPEEICYSQECVEPLIRGAGNIIYKKFGIRTNSDYADEKYVKGNIRIHKYK